MNEKKRKVISSKEKELSRQTKELLKHHHFLKVINDEIMTMQIKLKRSQNTKRRSQKNFLELIEMLVVSFGMGTIFRYMLLGSEVKACETLLMTIFKFYPNEVFMQCLLLGLLFTCFSVPLVIVNSILNHYDQHKSTKDINKYSQTLCYLYSLKETEERTMVNLKEYVPEVKLAKNDDANYDVYKEKLEENIASLELEPANSLKRVRKK